METYQAHNRVSPLPEFDHISVLIVSMSKNPYVAEIASGLSEFFQIKRSITDFFGKDKNYDIIHIQWPEEITAWSIPSFSELERVKVALQYWSKKAGIIVTRHNVLPNKENPQEYKPLYDLVYSFADAVIHLGKQSLNDYHKRYPKQCKETLHRIIPHHVYVSYPNKVSRFTARKYLHISEKDTVILCFGTIRNKEQFKRILKAYYELDLPNKCLLIPRYKASKFVSRRYILKRIIFVMKRWHYNRLFNIKLRVGFIESDVVQYYFNAADVVFVPRAKQLNSGVVFLALAFNKPITGPSKGNMEEAIKYFGYPVFNPDDSISILSALKKSIALSVKNEDKLAARELGPYNLQYSLAKHKELYLQLLDKQLGRKD